MTAWGFVALAYGIVWGVLGIYAFCLKRRYRAAALELARLNDLEENGTNGQG